MKMGMCTKSCKLFTIPNNKCMNPAKNIFITETTPIEANKISFAEPAVARTVVVSESFKYCFFIDFVSTNIVGRFCSYVSYRIVNTDIKDYKIL